jgi:SAM-dependent methyltransferase
MNAPKPDRDRWNARYLSGFGSSFRPHPLAEQALALGLPTGPALELACGASGSALLLAAAGHRVTAVDVSDVALGLLAAEAAARGLASRIELVDADLADFVPPPEPFALVLCTGYWDECVFDAAAGAVAPGGLIGWEALTDAARRDRPGLPAQWCLAGGQPASLLPAGFAVLEQSDSTGPHAPKRRLLARRAQA